MYVASVLQLAALILGREETVFCVAAIGWRLLVVGSSCSQPGPRGDGVQRFCAYRELFLKLICICYLVSLFIRTIYRSLQKF